MRPKKTGKKYALPAPQERPAVNPAVSVGGSRGSPDALGPEGMTAEELEYRTLLQEAILWATKQVMDEQREEILLRAEARVKTLSELRG